MRKTILLLLGIIVWNSNFALPAHRMESKWTTPPATLSAACDTPKFFFVDTISCTWSTFSWDSVKNATSYVFKIRNSDINGSPYVTYYPKGTWLLVDGLTEATDYCAKIATVCGPGDTSAYTIEQCWQQNYTDCIYTTTGAIPSNAFKIFPNPSKGNFKIQYRGDAEEITVRNSIGQVVYQISPVSSAGINEQPISLKQKGLYIVQLKFGQKTYETTIVIE